MVVRYEFTSVRNKLACRIANAKFSSREISASSLRGAPDCLDDRPASPESISLDTPATSLRGAPDSLDDCPASPESIFLDTPATSLRCAHDSLDGRAQDLKSLSLDIPATPLRGILHHVAMIDLVWGLSIKNGMGMLLIVVIEPLGNVPWPGGRPQKHSDRHTHT